MKKYFEVSLIMTSIQTKYVEAKSKAQAELIVADEDWDEKEEVIDSRTTVKKADISDVKGRYVLKLKDGEVVSEHVKFTI